jgi:hypothetical protein
MKTPMLMGCFITGILSMAQAAPPAAAMAERNAMLSTFGTISTIAGSGIAGENDPDNNDWVSAYEGGAAIAANLSNPHMADADALGNVYIADKASHSILKVTPAGTIHTWAGTHVDGFTGDGPALGSSLRLSQPNGLYVLPNGTVYVYDTGNKRIRRIAPNGMMQTVIADPDPLWMTSGRGLWVNQAETLIYYTMEVDGPATGANSIGGVVKKWTPTGGITAITRYPASPTAATLEFKNPGNIDVNPINGKLYVTDRAEDDSTPARSKVWRIDTEGSAGSACVKVAVAGSGVSTIPGGDGFLATQTFLNEVRGISFMPNGGYFLVTHQGGDAWYVDTYGYIHLMITGKGSNNYLAGDGLTLPAISGDYLSEPRSIRVSSGGHLLITTNDSGVVRKVPRIVAPPAPRLLSCQLTNGPQFHVTWESVIGRTYLVERSFSLQSNSWQVQQVVTATAASCLYMDVITAPQPRAFYRISPPR